MTEESGRPGTWRSKVGCEAIDEPCTKRIVPALAAAGALRHRKRRTSPLLVQCSLPLMMPAPSCVGPAGNMQEYQPRTSLEEDRNVGRYFRPRHVSQAAAASRKDARRAAGNAGKGPRYLA